MKTAFVIYESKFYDHEKIFVAVALSKKQAKQKCQDDGFFFHRPENLFKNHGSQRYRKIAEIPLIDA